MNTKTLRYINKALEASLDSDYHRIRIGAVVVSGNRLLSTGRNSVKAHTAQAYYNRQAGRITCHNSRHAELDAIMRSNRASLKGATIYVGRWQLDGRLGMCRPCSSCCAAIREAGIRKVYYTTPDGVRKMEM